MQRSPRSNTTTTRPTLITRPLTRSFGDGWPTTASPLFAHHSWPVDFSKEITVKGTVMDFNWGNPHVMFHLNVQDTSGKVQQWNVGGPSTNRMAANGWEKTTLKPGDVITATGYK